MVRKDVIAIGGFLLLFLVTMWHELHLMSESIDFFRSSRNTDKVWPEYETSGKTAEEPDVPLEFDDTGEETEEWKAKQPQSSGSPSILPVITTILPSKNSNLTLTKLWGRCTNKTFERREKITHGIHVIMSFFKGVYKKDRFGELLIALRRNLKNPYVTAVHALWEDRDPIDYVNSTVLDKKLIRVQFGVQPTYKDFFDYANLRLGRGAVGVVLNSDIYLDDTLACVQPVTPERRSFNATKQHLVYALSRHPSNPCAGRADYCENYIGSHDVFVFALPLPAKFSKRLDFTQNHIAAENVVIWEFKQLDGYLVKNPCQTVKAYHIHCTNERHYNMGAISRGKNRIGPFDRHGSVMSSKIRCGQVIY